MILLLLLLLNLTAASANLVALKVNCFFDEDCAPDISWLRYLGPAGGLQGYHLYEVELTRVPRSFVDLKTAVESLVGTSHKTHDKRSLGVIQWAELQAPLKRSQRSYNDPLWPDQWHLKKLDIENVWERLGITGKGTVVSVIDDGLQYTHPDLQDSYVASISYDYNRHSNNPLPASSEDNHGTRCAAQISAKANNLKCGIGISPGTKLGAQRLLAGPVSDALEGAALSNHYESFDISTNSWGPIDDGKTTEGPGIMAQSALQLGVEKGRSGLGLIYVFASGNGGLYDNCGFDGYVNSIYTLAIGALSWADEIPSYQEICAKMFAVTYSSDSQHRITTSDINNGCTSQHGGTSAAAPLAAGIISLMLEANPRLGWRDVQHIIASHAIQVNPNHPGWYDLKKSIESYDYKQKNI